MAEIDRIRNDLVIANRVLAWGNIVDAYGHVSVRHPLRPDRFFLSRSRSPFLVEASDILEFALDGNVVGDDDRPPYLERFIHAAIYEARSDVAAVIHAHAEDILPFSISTTTRLQAVIGPGSDLGHEAPVWDIREKFGDATNLLVTKIEHGRDLARRLANNAVCLTRPWFRSGAADSSGSRPYRGLPATQRTGADGGDAAWRNEPAFVQRDRDKKESTSTRERRGLARLGVLGASRRLRRSA